MPKSHTPSKKRKIVERSPSQEIKASYSYKQNIDFKSIQLNPKEVWRLFTDGVVQHKGFMDFESHEPGYYQAMFKAFAYAIMCLNEDITIDFIKKIHAFATVNVRGTEFS